MTANPSTSPPGKASTPVAMPAGRLVGATVLAGALAGLAAWGLCLAVRPGSAPGAPWGALAGTLGTLAGVLVIQPWKARPVVAWGMTLLASQGVSFFGVILFGVGLYSASRPDPVGLLVGAVAAFVCALLAQATVAGARMKAAIAG